MTRFARLLAALLSLLSVTACEQNQTGQSQSEAVRLSGELHFRERVALPAGSQVTLRLENLAALPGTSAVVAEKTFRLEQQQVPIRFQMQVYRDQHKADQPYILRGLINSPDGRMKWTSDKLQPLTLTEEASVHLAPLNMKLVATADGAQSTTLFVCGTKTLTVRRQGDSLQLHINDDVYHLQAVRAASGAKYQSADGEMVFWNKGNDATLNMADVRWPFCTRVSADILALFPFRAHGNEPGWSMSAEIDKVELKWNYGKQQLVMPYPQLDVTHSGFVLHSETDERLLRVNVLTSLCRDTMSGIPYPQHVDIHFGKLDLIGCGGDSRDLLTGQVWQVEDIDGRGIIDASHITMAFDDQGRLSGSASCNQYSTAYEFNEQLDIGDPIATRKACAPALMNQENRFLSLLAKINRLDFDDKGALLLSTADGNTITARR